ncbi:EamA domain-containing membrane protein RarD [Plantibacter sp. VKM Ac-1784]|uniref:EamA domain-containing membrane protein RarD n=1 Tax=Plantibacter elymi (nom. nud.) TaxID=199708 RepID=A0ABY1R7Q8_9MICO|nr:DMT family transporter [Plantibacter sp. VKM Ac-1784]SMQ59564.1 EamA domain-containing membrane protein RarD [Plantibacter sp. VKM Ac-1784]
MSTAAPNTRVTALVAPGSRRVLGAYLGAALIWGASFLFMKTGLTGLAPAQVALSRVVLGALTLCIIMLVTRRRWPRERRLWAHLAVVSVFLCVAPFLLFSWAGQFLPSGLSSILNASTPIMTLAVGAVFLPKERLNGLQVFGIFVGALGVAIVVGPWRVLGDPAILESIPAQLACLGATLCYGIAFVYLRKFVLGTHSYDAVVISAVEISLAAVIMLVLSPFIAMQPVSLDAPVVLSMLALGALGTGVAYIWMTTIVDSWGPTAASTVTYLTPLVGVVLGIVVLGEILHWNEPVGGVIVVLGILVSQGRLRLRRRTPPLSA